MARLLRSSTELAKSNGTQLSRVFVSSDFDNDQQLNHLRIGRAKQQNLPFAVVDDVLREVASGQHLGKSVDAMWS